MCERPIPMMTWCWPIASGNIIAVASTPVPSSRRSMLTTPSSFSTVTGPRSPVDHYDAAGQGGKWDPFKIGEDLPVVGTLMLPRHLEPI